jgi:anti-anti-sigma factor
MHGAVALFDVMGDVTVSSEPFFKEAYQNISDQGTAKILLKFNEDTYINSGGIAVLIQLLAETKKRAQVIGITGLSDHFKKIFKMVGITKFAEIYPSVDEGLKKLDA